MYKKFKYSTFFKKYKYIKTSNKKVYSSNNIVDMIYKNRFLYDQQSQYFDLKYCDQIKNFICNQQSKYCDSKNMDLGYMNSKNIDSKDDIRDIIYIYLIIFVYVIYNHKF